MTIHDLNLEQRIGQVLCCGFPEPYAAAGVKDLITSRNLGNIILFQRNFGGSGRLYNMLRELQADAMAANGLPLFVAIDQEGGYVTRLWSGVTVFPGAMAVSAAGSVNDGYLISRAMGRELHALGINVDFAPVLDINTNPENPVIGTRSFGDKPETVAAYGTAMTKGLQENVIATGKHFPGHGDTRLDSHLTLPVVERSRDKLAVTELYPFKTLINQGLKAIMTSHIVFPAYDPDRLPATLSEPVLTGLLRNELGFKGLIFTDCMEMKAISDFYGTPKAVVMALAAGADIILVSHHRDVQEASMDAVKTAVKADISLMAKLDLAVERVLRYKAELTPTGSYEDMMNIVSTPQHKTLSANVSRRSLTVYRGQAPVFARDDGFSAVFFKPAAITGIEEQDADESSDLGLALKAVFKNAAITALLQDPAEEAVNRAVSGLAGSTPLVIFTYSAILSDSQSSAVNKLLEARPGAYVVAMRSPYDIRRFPQAQNYVLAYEYTPNAIAAVVAMLRGELAPLGIAPVEPLK